MFWLSIFARYKPSRAVVDSGGDMEPEKKNLKVFKEDVKMQHTAHWDWDYLTHAQIDARLKNAQPETESVEPVQARRRGHIWIWIVTAIVFIAGGIWIGYRLFD